MLTISHSWYQLASWNPAHPVFLTFLYFQVMSARVLSDNNLMCEIYFTLQSMSNAGQRGACPY